MQTDGDKQAEEQIRQTRLKLVEKKMENFRVQDSARYCRGSRYQTNNQQQEEAALTITSLPTKGQTDYWFADN